MSKQESLVNLSTIFNRGAGSDTDVNSYFIGKKHDELLDTLIGYIQNSQHLIGNPKITKAQSLNDHGVDIIIEFPDGTKIGIQVKSPFDVQEKEFVVKVKAQMTESQMHGLDKWYLFICSPFKVSNRDLTQRIGNLVNEFSGYKTPYHIVYTPQQCLSILTGTVMDQSEFQAIKNQFFLGTVDWSQILSDVARKQTESYLSNIPSTGEVTAKNAIPFLNHINYDLKDQKDLLEDLEKFQLTLKSLTKKTREFLFAVVQRSHRKDSFRAKLITNAKDIENHLNLNPSQVNKEIDILENHKLGYADVEEGTAEIMIVSPNKEYHTFDAIKTYCKDEKELRAILVDLNFSLLDE